MTSYFFLYCRRVFPYLEFTVVGLDPEALYRIAIEIYPIDQTRYKYVDSTWLSVSETDVELSPAIAIHENSPSKGSFWMKDVISFKKNKVTNNEGNAKGHVSVRT